MAAKDETQAEEAFKKAEGKCKAIIFKDYEGAVELFNSAGAQFKLAKNYVRAGEAYMRAGDIAIRLKDPAAACNAYTESANSLKKVDVKKAGVMLGMAIQLNIENNRLGSAARLEREYAESLETDGQLEEAIVHFSKAMDYFIAEDQPQAAMGCRVKIAKIHGDLDHFDKCYELYEEIGSTYTEGPLKHQAKEYFVRALLCRLTEVTTDNRTEKCAECNEAWESYKQIDIYLKNTRESEFCEQVLSAVDEDDVDKFDEAVALLNELRMLDEWKTHVLLVIKKNFEQIL